MLHESVFVGPGYIPWLLTLRVQGKTVAAPPEWLKGPTERYDVAFITVDKPFTGVKPLGIKPIKYVNTPAKGKLTLGVVGYPGDKQGDGEVCSKVTVVAALYLLDFTNMED